MTESREQQISFIEAVNRLKSLADHNRSCVWQKAVLAHSRTPFPSCDCGLIWAMDAVDELVRLIERTEQVNWRNDVTRAVGVAGWREELLEKFAAGFTAPNAASPAPSSPPLGDRR